MDFTVVTPNLNGARYLDECLHSVAIQSGVSVEHIVVDGGSSDSSEDIVRRYPDVVWRSEGGAGISDAINIGFNRSKGDWVMWLNSDDRLNPGALSAVKRRVEGCDGVDILYGSFNFIDARGAVIRTMKLFRWIRFVSVHHCSYVPSTAAFYKRSTVIDVGLRLREDFHYVMDGEYYARLSSLGKTFCYFPIVLADFRLHSENQSMKYLGKTRDMNRVLAAEKQHVESRAIRRVYGITLFEDPYLNGLVDGFLWLMGRVIRIVVKCFSKVPKTVS